MDIFNRKRSTAAVQEAERLILELGAMKLENEKLDDKVECYLGKYVMKAKARRRLDLHLAMLRDMLEEWKRWPRGKPYELSECHLQHLRNLAEADRRVEEAREKAEKASHQPSRNPSCI